MAVLGSYEGSIASAAAAQAYVATVIRLPGGPPLAYWRLASPDSLLDEMGARNGSWTIPGGSLVSGLPQGSDGAVDFKGVAAAQVPHDPGLALPAFTLSFWFRLNALPVDGVAVLVSKDATGLGAGDFATWVDENGELIVQFQSGSAQFPITGTVAADTTYHMAVLADGSGFRFYLDGQFVTSSTLFTGAWSSNTKAIRFATAPWTPAVADAVIDEVALYDRVLTESEIVALSERTAAPTAAGDSFVAPENLTTVLDVVGNDTYVGQKADLTVEIVSQPSIGTAIVRSDNDIDFTADTLSDDEDDSFTYRITDANGTSNTASVNVTVQNSTSLGGGTLVYDWHPLASWIDGVALANRNADDVDSVAFWQNASAATVGASLPRAMHFGGPRTNYCFNRAPTGHPSIECRAQAGANGCINIGVQLWNALSQGAGPHPRHVRVVMEIKTCKSSDPTTFKANGIGTTTGSYPNWRVCHTPGATGDNAAVKYFIGLFGGEQPGGGANVNWWGNSALAIDRLGHRCQSGGSSKDFANYLYHFDRPGIFGLSDRTINNSKITDIGVEGVWHRLELEWKLADPSTIPNNARRSEPEIEPSHTGNGFVKQYLTKDVDGELGTPGTRQLICDTQGIMDFCRFDDIGSDDNMHTLANIAGFWVMHIFGGSQPAQAEAWAWIRRIQVFQHS